MLNAMTAAHSALVAARRWLTVAVAGLCTAFTVSAQPADGLIVKRDTQLRSAPADNAPAVAPVKASTPVTRLPERQGAYVRATVEGKTGWLHMFDIGSPAAASTTAASGGGSNVLRGLGSMFARPTSTTVSTTTVGIRGLDANDIANAQPNVAAVTTAEGLRVSATDAQQFAAQSSLRAQTVDDLPIPQRRPGDAN